MVSIDDIGMLTFTLRSPGAERVELIGTFSGWHEESWPMERGSDGTFVVTLDPGPGEFFFRYRIDGVHWRIDDAAHGLVEGADGILRSRVWRPPTSFIVDPQAA